ncbi:MAG: MFS transporter, partial [Gammaproteobacteria bacterium]|nr:MFS transporter [Gammaproteobacteria bacterium]
MPKSVAVFFWPIFLGILFITLGNGLQAILSGWRADAEGFSVATIGWMMTGYPVGTLIGSLFSPYLVRLSGHVRAYA